MSINLAAERAASLARQEERDRPHVMRHRARRVLELRWNATVEELREAIAETWPNMDESGREEILAVAIDVQKTERPTIKPELTTTMPKAIPDATRAKIHQFVTEFRAEHPSAAGLKAYRTLTRDPSIRISESAFYRDYWPKKAKANKPQSVKGGKATKGRKLLAVERPKQEPVPTPDATDAELEEDRRDYEASLITNRMAKDVTFRPDPNNHAAADVEFSEAVHGNGNGKAPDAPAASTAELARRLMTENASLRATYEADDFLRLEEEGGEFRVRASLRFGTRSDAAAALAALAGAV